MDEPIFVWAMRSSQPRAGKIITYATQLNIDGTLSCDCPGWIFKKKDQLRGCKHTRQVEQEGRDLYRTWRAGGILPELDEVTATQMTGQVLGGRGRKAGTRTGRIRASEPNPSNVPKESTIRYGRVIHLD